MSPRIKKPMKPEAATLRLEDLCARSEQCSSDLRRKLSGWGISSSDSDSIMRHLSENRFVDDSRFARAFVRDRYRFAGWGRRKIISGLYAKRIAKGMIDDAMAEIDVRQYASIAFKAIAARLRQLPEDMDPRDKRMRLMRFAAGRGYEVALIIKILESERLWTSSGK